MASIARRSVSSQCGAAGRERSDQQAATLTTVSSVWILLNSNWGVKSGGQRDLSARDLFDKLP